MLWLVSAYMMMTTRVNRLAKDSFDELSKEINREENWSCNDGGEIRVRGEPTLIQQIESSVASSLKGYLHSTLVISIYGAISLILHTQNFSIFIWAINVIQVFKWNVTFTQKIIDTRYKTLLFSFLSVFSSNWRFVCVVYWIIKKTKWRWSSWNAIIQKMFDIRLT